MNHYNSFLFGLFFLIYIIESLGNIFKNYTVEQDDLKQFNTYDEKSFLLIPLQIPLIYFYLFIERI